MNDLDKAKEIFKDKQYTCVLCKGNEVYTSFLRGIKPLVIWYESKNDFIGYSACDKVIGKATAFLYVLLKVESVYAEVISQCALTVLNKNGINTQYKILTENIINRTKDGICPFELAVLDISDKFQAYRAICDKMKELNITLE